MNNKYYLGIDLGTDSIGWAATDEEYNFLRLRGKTAWGSRIFTEAKDKKQTRSFRSNRRRIQRRKYRIDLLNELFAEEINKIDNIFFLRLENSTYLLEDKEKLNIGKNLLFKTYEEEKKFYKEYPTIWNLRKKLIENDSNALDDIRKVYLAIHHIIKYRGNFLHDGTYNYSDFDGNLLDEINECLKNKCSKENEDTDDIEYDYISSKKSNDFKNIILNDNLSGRIKQTKIKELFDVNDKKKYIDLFATIVVGGKYKLNKINDDWTSEVDFNNNFDDCIIQIQTEMGESFEIVLLAKEIYDFIVLNTLLGNNKYISYVMDEIYTNHKKDLLTLKKVIVEIDKKKNLNGNDRIYYQVFKDKNNDLNYCSLVHVNTDTKRCERDKFLKYIETIIETNKDFIIEKDYSYLIDRINKKELLRTISIASTSVIPYQLHETELNMILENASVKYPFLKYNKDKIVSLLKFRVPYYYGPLDTNSKYSNAVRITNERVTPWNFTNVFDDNKTKEKFMNSLTNSCSYLFGEKVLPKVSLYYEKYLILDRLNTMTVNGNYLSNSTKNELYEYICSRSKTSLSNIKSHLATFTNTKTNDIVISGIKEDVDFEATSHATLSKFFDFKNVELIEKLIFLATIYNDNKKTLKEILNKEFSILSIEQKTAILNLPTKKWARLSKALLCDIHYVDDNGLAYNILDLLACTNKNFQMILNDSIYNYHELIKVYNSEKSGILSTQEQIQEILDNCPSFTKRSINQALLIIDDVIKANNRIEPTKIFIESTRENDINKKGKEKNSRYKELNLFINSIIKSPNCEYKENTLRVKEELESFINDNIRLKSKHIYLYFKQLGMDLYTGESIKLEDVIKTNNYDVDHIIPQSLIKDDSIDNLALVNREMNQKIKKDYYPIPSEISNNDKVRKLWQFLRKKGSISEKKYNNLIRAKEIGFEEIEGFVARQINAIDYSNMALKNILEIKYPNSKIVFSKAQYPHLIREKLEIAKNRSLNDVHHAVDAYLNVVAGDILSTKFSDLRTIYARKNEKHEGTFNMDKILLNELEIRSYTNKVKDNSLRHDALVTYKVDYNNGQFYDQTIYKAAKDLIPIHTNKTNPMNNTEKYGGYSGLKQTYIMAVQFEDNGKIKKQLLRVPLLYVKQSKNESELISSVINKPNVKNVKIVKKIQLNQKIKYNNCIYLLYTANENCNKYKMAYQNYINNDSLMYLDKANKHLGELLLNVDSQEFILNRKNDVFVVSKEKNTNLFLELMSKINNDIYDSCNYIVSARTMSLQVFNELDLKEQIDTLNNMIVLLSRTSESGKISSKFEFVTSNFKLLKSNDITKDIISIIYESPSGLWCKKEKI